MLNYVVLEKGRITMRLIDANELKNMLDMETLDGQRIAFFIDEQPTIDAVEVIRCKDCTFCSHEYYLDEYDDLYPFYCEIWMKGIDSFDSYCSYGKKDDE